MHPAHVTGLVDALEAAGFAQRTPHRADRRAIVVSLTAKGESLIASWGADRTANTMQLLSDTSASDLAVFSKVLGRVMTRLRAAFPDSQPVPRKPSAHKHPPPDYDEAPRRPAPPT